MAHAHLTRPFAVSQKVFFIVVAVPACTGILLSAKILLLSQIMRALRWCRAVIRQASAAGHVAATQIKVMQASRVVLSFSSTRSRVGLFCLELCRKQGYRTGEQIRLLAPPAPQRGC